MPYILRNPFNVWEYLGHNGFMRVKNSLIIHFRDNPILESKQIAGDSYPTLTIKDISNPAKQISFYVISSQNGWHRLAFKEFIG